MQKRLDEPWRTCDECEALHEQNAETFPYPCEGCPNVLLAQSGDVSLLAREVAYLMSLNPNPEAPVDWPWLFHLVGVRSRTKQREVYERIGLWAKLEREHAEAMKPENLRTVRNPAAD